MVVVVFGFFYFGDEGGFGEGGDVFGDEGGVVFEVGEVFDDGDGDEFVVFGVLFDLWWWLVEVVVKGWDNGVYRGVVC